MGLTGLTAWWLPSEKIENGGQWIINDSPGTISDDSISSGEALTSEEDYFDTPDFAYWLIPEIEEKPEEDEPENSEEPEDSEEPENSEETENTDDNDADNDTDSDTDNDTDNNADN